MVRAISPTAFHLRVHLGVNVCLMPQAHILCLSVFFGSTVRSLPRLRRYLPVLLIGPLTSHQGHSRDVLEWDAPHGKRLA